MEACASYLFQLILLSENSGESPKKLGVASPQWIDPIHNPARVSTSRLCGYEIQDPPLDNPILEVRLDESSRFSHA